MPLDVESHTKIGELIKHYNYSPTNQPGFRSEEHRDVYFLLGVVDTLQDLIAEITKIVNEAPSPQRYRFVQNDDGVDFLIKNEDFDEFLEWSALDTESDDFYNWKGTNFDDCVLETSTWYLSFENPKRKGEELQ